MNRSSLRVGLAVVASLVFAASPVAESSAQAQEAAPGKGVASPDDLADERAELARLEAQRDRLWNWMIASSVVAITGVGLTVGGTSRCSAGLDSCDTTGKALGGTGIALLSLGSVGVLVTGVMLGVGAGKRNRLELWIKARSQAKLRWDPHRGAFVF